MTLGIIRREGVQPAEDRRQGAVLCGRAGGRIIGLIVTRGHRHDALVLKEWIHRLFLFLGMIGSARKARTI